MRPEATQRAEQGWPSNSQNTASISACQRSSDKCRSDIESIELSARLTGLRRGFAARRADFSGQTLRLETGTPPRPGDLLLAQVSRIGQHARLELPSGRRSHLHVGDEILVTYGHRYAADQFEAEIPENLAECHLVAAGGIAARMLNRHARVKEATRIRPLGLIASADGAVLNLSNWRVDSRPIPKSLPPVLVVAGTSMNAGKTTAAAALVKGLHRSGKRVGAAKITGTGAGGDYWQMTDAGAAAVVDFTDAGHASTYLLAPNDVEHIFLRLIGYLAGLELDVIVVEVADGLLQPETANLLASPALSTCCQGVVFAAGDSMGAVSGVEWLHRRGLVVNAVSGTLTSSPLAIRETSTATGLPVLGKKALAQPDSARAILAGRA